MNTHNSPIQLFLVDPHLVVRFGLRTIIARQANMQVSGEANCLAEALQPIAQLRPNIVLLDLKQLDAACEAMIGSLLTQPAPCKVVILSEFCEGHLARKALQMGISGYLLKEMSPAELVCALQRIASGCPVLHPRVQRILLEQINDPAPPRPVLTKREQVVLDLLALGMSNRMIARTLVLTEGTVKGYISTILEKLAVRDRTQAALCAVHHGMVTAGSAYQL